MENITKNRCFTTIPGYLKIAFAPIGEVQTIELIDINTKKVTFNAGGRFAEIDAQNIQFGNSESDGAYDTVISCDFRGSYPELVHLFDNMTKTRHIVTLMDRNSIWWLQGDMSEPMRFEYSQLTDSKPTGFTGYRLKFLRKTTLPVCKLSKGQ
jgi:hypothetical protein